MEQTVRIKPTDNGKVMNRLIVNKLIYDIFIYLF